MVIARHLLIGVACLYASIAAAVTADELRGAAAEQDHETTQRQGRTDTGSIGSLLPGDSQTSSKYDTDAKTATKKRAARKTAAKKHDAAAASGVGEVYTPPPRSSAVSGGQAIVTDAVNSCLLYTSPS